VIRIAQHCIVLVASLWQHARARTGGQPRATAGAASYQTIPGPQPNIAGFPTSTSHQVSVGYLTVLENRAARGTPYCIFVMRAPRCLDNAEARSDRIPSGAPGGAGSFEVAFMVKHGSTPTAKLAPQLHHARMNNPRRSGVPPFAAERPPPPTNVAQIKKWVAATHLI
jgi:hypothetical protein